MIINLKAFYFPQIFNYFEICNNLNFIVKRIPVKLRFKLSLVKRAYHILCNKKNYFQSIL